MLTATRAKRYERMLKHHGIHPNGGHLDIPAPLRKSSVPTPKVSKKRKCEDVSGTIKQDEDEERKLPVPKRFRNEQHQEIKQEPPPMTYPPYPFHPMMPPQVPYHPRPMPYMHQGMPHSQPHFMQHLPHPPQNPYSMMPSMHNNHQFMMPIHQMQPFSINQTMPSQSQDSNNLSSFDDFCNQDFGSGSFETLLHGEPAATRVPNEFLHSETPPVSQGSQQMSMNLQPEKTPTQVKAEPCQSFDSPICDVASTNEPLPVSLSTQESMTDLSAISAVAEPSLPVLSNIPTEPIQHSTEIETALAFKQENEENCILISD